MRAPHERVPRRALPWCRRGRVRAGSWGCWLPWCLLRVGVPHRSVRVSYPWRPRVSAAVVGLRHGILTANSTNRPAICASFREALGGARAAAPSGGVPGMMGGRPWGLGTLPRTRRGATVWAWQALRRRGGTGCGRGPCRACGDASRDRSFRARRGVPRSGAITRLLRPVCNATKGL